MVESEKINQAAKIPFANESVAVIVPLFPPLPGLSEALASLAAQTRPPNLVLLLNDGSVPKAESLQDAMPELNMEVLTVPRSPKAIAINSAVKHLDSYSFLGFLEAGSRYAPERIQRCLETLLPSEGKLAPAMVLTRLQAVNGKGVPLPENDPRVTHLERLWAGGDSGVSLSEWLGQGNFAATTSNIFADREHLTLNPLPEKAKNLSYAAVTIAGLQECLFILQDPLLLHYPPPVAVELTTTAVAEQLETHLALLAGLQVKMQASPKNRRNLTAFHRAAWNNLSGLREDIFQQVILRLASNATADESWDAAKEILRSRDAQTTPAYLSTLIKGSDTLDMVAYAQALQRTRETLAKTEEDKNELHRIAEAAQGSGWIRFGAWLGERGARRMMQLEEEDLPEGTSKSF